MSNSGREPALGDLLDTLADRRVADAGLRSFRLREKPFLELVNVRGARSSAPFATALMDAYGVDLPGRPNTVGVGATHAALWLGPDEWLLQSHEPRATSAERTLRPLLSGEPAAVVDVSSGYVVLELTGTRAREVLQKGCPLDLHPRAFAIGQCAQSHFFKAGIVLRPVAPDAYELIVRRSFAHYAARMLLDTDDD